MRRVQKCSVQAIPALALGVLVSGCADLITVTSQPLGADVVIDGIPRGRTPLLTHVIWSSRGTNQIILRKDGYHTRVERFQKVWRWDWIAVDLALTPAAGIGLVGLFFNARGPELVQHFALQKEEP